MKNLISIFGLLCLALYTSDSQGVSFIVEDCKGGDTAIKSELRDAQTFNTIDINGVFDVTIKKDKPIKIRITGPEDILPRIVTQVENQKLDIYANKSICTKFDIKIDIQLPDIYKIILEGANRARISGINDPNLFLKVNGASEVLASGHTNTLTASVSGASSLDARNLNANIADVSITGSAEASIYATKKIDAGVSGAGSLICYGNPKMVSKNILEAGAMEIK